MKKSVLIICTCLFTIIGITQTVTFTFQAEDAQTNNFVALQSVLIENLTMDCDTTIYGINPSITLGTVGVIESNQGNSEPIEIISATPNPFIGSTYVYISLKKEDYYNFYITNLKGNRIAAYRQALPAGVHKFEITSSGKDLLIFNVSNSANSKFIKLLSLTDKGSDGIKHIGYDGESNYKIWEIDPTTEFVFNPGDELLFTANANGYNEQTIEDAPVQSNNYTFEMTPLELEDGYYIVGSTTACPELNLNGMLKITRNEVTQTEREELLEIYIPIQGDLQGFSIVQVDGSNITTYGPGIDFDWVLYPSNDEPQVPFQRGGFTETATKFTVPVDGMYHVALDTEVEIIAVVPVVYWGMIGAATPFGWGDDTEMPPLEFNLYSMTFQITDLVMTNGDWKFRYSGGWKVIIDPDYNGGGPDNGIKVNANFGGALDSLVPGGYNIPNEIPGIYTSSMFWNIGQPYTAELIKTGDIPYIDYTDTELGFVGDGLIVNGIQHNWDETAWLQFPVVVDITNYYWTWENIEVTTAGSFKIREGQDWNNLIIGYNEVIMAGLSAGDFETNNDGNFIPLVNGIYDMDLYIDAVTEIYTLTVNPPGITTEMYMVGTFQGWDPDAAVPMTASGGDYTATIDFMADGHYKFITTPGEWFPQYGTDLTGTWETGPLVYFDGSGVDPESIAEPEVAGTYIVSMNINNMTYTVVAAK